MLSARLAILVAASLSQLGVGYGAEVASKELPTTCELHIFPTNYYVVLVSAPPTGIPVFSPEGRAAMELSTKDIGRLLKEFLPAEEQVTLLATPDLIDDLGLPENTTLIVEEPTPPGSNSDGPDKRTPITDSRRSALRRAIKGKVRMASGNATCHAELITNYVLFQNGLFNGLRLQAGWTFRRFDGEKLIIHETGENVLPISDFPPQSQSQFEVSQASVRSAFVSNFQNWLRGAK